jgi:hypothetical protein
VWLALHCVRQGLSAICSKIVDFSAIICTYIDCAHTVSLRSFGMTTLMLCYLQRSYYTPVAKWYGTVAGSAVAFTVSGLFHEYMYASMLFWGAPQGVYRFGEVLVFFLLMFVMCCAPWWNTRQLTQVRPCICYSTTCTHHISLQLLRDSLPEPTL